MKEPSTDRDAARLRALLDSAAPEDEATAGRADAAVRRSRRNRARKGVAGGIVIGAVAAAVVITPHFLETSPTTNEYTDPSNGVDVVEEGSAFAADPCPRRPIDVSDPTVVPRLPSDPGSIRLCTASMEVPWDKEPATSMFVPPADALVTETEEFVDAVDGAPGYDAAECAAVDYAWSPFALVLTGQDGGQVVLGAAAPICNAVEIGGRQVSVDWLTATFMDALAVQRDAMGEPVDVPLPACPPDAEHAYSTFVNDEPTAFEDGASTPTPTTPTAGVICAIGGGGVSRGELDADEVRMLVEDIEANQSGEDGECVDLDVVRVLRLVDAWGDVTTWTESGCEGGYQHDGSFWTPGTEAEAILTAAFT